MKYPSLLSSAAIRLAVVGAVVIAATYLLIVRPGQASLAQAAADRTELISTNLKNSEKRRLLAAAQQRYTTLSSDLSRLQGVIPEASDTGSFVTALQNIASETGVSIQGLTTKIQVKTPPRASQKNAEQKTPTTSSRTLEQELLQSFHGTSIDLRLSGSYQSIRGFVQRIREMERFVSISSFNLAAGRQSGGTATDTLDCNLTMTIFHRQPAKEGSS